MNQAFRQAAVWALSAAVVSISGAATKTFDKKFSVAPGGTVWVNTEIGSVSIVGTAENEVSVNVSMKGSQHDLDRFEVSAVQTEKGVEVTGKGGGHRGWFFWNSSDLEARFTIKVPHAYNVSVKTSGGDVDVSDLKGDVKSSTSGGNVMARSLEGALDLRTSGGNVSVDKATGELHAETSGGEVVVTSVTGAVNARTSGGNVQIKGADGKIRAQTSGGDITVDVHGQNKGVFAETSGGNIYISLPKSVSATIDASTSGGDVVCDLPVSVQGRIDESRLRGDVNGGGNLIHAHTSGGDVRIRALP